MKPLVILTRILCVGLFWSLFFIEGVRVIMLRNWHFDIFQTAHWNHAWNLWLSGWVIRTPKEWAFVLIILTFIPLWLCGWSALSLIKWEKIAVKAADFPVILFRKFFFRPVKIITTSGGMKNIKKKKSYKEVRPKSLRLPLDERPDVMPSNLLQSPRAKFSAPQSAANFGATPVGQTNPTPAPTPKFLETPVSSEPKQFSHSLFDMDSKDDDFDFNIDDFDLAESDNKKSSPEEAPRKNLPQKRDNQREMRDNSPKDNSSRDNAPRERNGKKNRDNNANLPATARHNNQPANTKQANLPSQPKGSGNSVLDVIKQHGFDVIAGATIKNNLIDFIGVAQNQIVLCLIDKETGDWLADEERFNDEEPLWFSESSHRISPVRKVDIARKVLTETLDTQGLRFEVKPFVIVSIGNIINAEDMFDIWDDLGVNVTRIDRGTPKEIKLFARTLPDAREPIGKGDFENIKKIIHNIA